MATTALPQPQQPTQAPQPNPVPPEATSETPSKRTPEQARRANGLTEQDEKNLLYIRTEYKKSWADIRRRKVREVSKAIEFVKGNQIISLDPENNQWFDPIEAAIDEANAGGLPGIELTQYCNNIYQMLMFSFIAALSPNVPKTRFWPGNAETEADLATAEAASSLQAVIERQNNIKGLQKQELMHLFNGGCYFVYNRWIRDSDRAGTKNVPVYELQNKEIFPDRYICPQCGADTPAKLMAMLSYPVCQACGYRLKDSDFYPAEHAEFPVQSGTEEVPNGKMQMSVHGTLNVDAAPYAQELYETPILDLEDDLDISSLRGSFFEAWDLFQTTTSTTTDEGGEQSRMAREKVYSSYYRGQYGAAKRVTYSRCWIQPWAFNLLDKKEDADRLIKKFPKGCMLTSFNGDKFLDVREEKMVAAWTWAFTVKGFGLYPPAVGKPAMDLQERMNDIAQIVHEHMDRNGSPTILADEDAIGTDEMNGKAMPAGTITGIKRKNNTPLSQVLFQPTFHADSNIYSYNDSLLQLAQLVTGVLPQIFGGSDPNVKTAQGQQQMLNVALGRLGLFWDNIREEHANRAVVGVKICASNLTEDVVDVIEADSESGFANNLIHLDELQGEFKAFPESDQGFPATYAETRDRMEKLLFEAANNPFIAAMLADPTNQKIVAMYVGPPGLVIPGDASRAKFKQVIDRLAKEAPVPGTNPITGAPMVLPSILPDSDFDDLDMLIEVAKQWGEKHFEMAEENPNGYENVRAYLRLASAQQAKNAMQNAPMPDGQGAPPPPTPNAAPQPVGAQ